MVRRAAIAGLVLACGCNQLLGLDAPGGDDDVDPDAGGDGAWGVASRIAIASQVGITEDDPALSPGGDQLYFGVQGAGDKNLVVATRAAATAPWDEAAESELSSALIDQSPRFALGLPPGEVVVYFASARLGTGLDIYTARAAVGGPFATPIAVANLSTIADDSTAAPCQAATRFVVATNRGGISSDLYEHVADTDVVAIEATNTAANETGPFLTEDCLRLYYASNVRGTFDIYLVTRPSVSAAWGTPEMVPGLSSSFDEGDPWLSPDERHILFTRKTDADFDIFEAFR